MQHGLDDTITFPVSGLTPRRKSHRCEAGWQWHPAPLPDYDLWYVLAGVGEMNWNGQAFPLSAGTCFVFPPGSQLTVITTRAAGCWYSRFTLRFPPVRLLPGADPSTQITQGAAVRDREFFTILAQRCENSFLRGGAWGLQRAALCLQQMLLQLQEETQQPPPSPMDSRLESVVAAIGKTRSALVGGGVGQALVPVAIAVQPTFSRADDYVTGQLRRAGARATCPATRA
jgi:hypothetical protein